MKLKNIYEAANRISSAVVRTPLVYNVNLSRKYGAGIYLKREDMQPVRSYKLRGAFNKMSMLNEEQKKKGVVCASAGNHAQGVAFSASRLEIKAVIFMPVTTPLQKIKQVELFGNNNVEIILTGDSFDDACLEAHRYCSDQQRTFIHPFDDEDIIAGQGTIALEILEEMKQETDFLFLPVGGGGLAAGCCTVFSELSPQTKIIAAEPSGAASMKRSIENGYNTVLSEIDIFTDGAAVKKVGDLPFTICKHRLHDCVDVPEGKICTTLLNLYNEEALVVEPAGALSIAALDFYSEKIKDKKVVCVVSGSNNDIERTPEIRERSMLYEGLKHYFIINFPQRPGSLKEFVNNILGKNDDITYFRFTQKTNREKGPAVVGIELKDKSDLMSIRQKLDNNSFSFEYLNNHPELFTQLVE